MITQFLNPFMLTITASLLRREGVIVTTSGWQEMSLHPHRELLMRCSHSKGGLSRGCGLAWKFPVEAILHHVYVLAGKNHFKRFNDTVALLKPY